ncbi:MAG: ketopantoate reductase family protein [Thermodesulfobacteriota bacterium]
MSEPLSIKNILIAGAGALGMVLGGFLREKGFKVTLLGRPSNIDIIKREGLTIEGIWGDHKITGFKCATNPGELQQGYDLAMVAVKSYATEPIVREILPFLKNNCPVVSFQNGLGNMEKIAELVGSRRTGGARVIFGAEVVVPGRVKVTVYADSVKVGALKPGHYPYLEKKLANLALSINSSGIPCEFIDNIHPYLWAKLIYNCALNPLGAILKVTYGMLAEREETRNIMNSIIQESFEVAKAKGVSLFWDSAEEYEEYFYTNLIPATYNHRSSMLQDIERRRKTEIEAMNDIVCKYGKMCGVKTPVNKTVANLIRYISV